MAKQVRPWLAKPNIFGAQQVHDADRGANQRIPSGTAGNTAYRFRMSAAISKEALGKPGASTYGYPTTGSTQTAITIDQFLVVLGGESRY